MIITSEKSNKKMEMYLRIITYILAGMWAYNLIPELLFLYGGY